MNTVAPDFDHEIYGTEDLLFCPYCGMQQYTHEPDDISADACCVTCEHCEKLFWYSVNVTRTYYPYR